MSKACKSRFLAAASLGAWLFVESTGLAETSVSTPPDAHTKAASPSSLSASELEAANRRLYADAFTVWIYKKPHRSRMPLGYLRAGQSVALKQSHRLIANNCKGGWYEVEPAGFVCYEPGVSLNPTRYTRAMETLSARAGAYPFDYGVSLGTPAFRRVPRPGEVATTSPKATVSTEPVWGEREMLATTPLVTSPSPWFLDAGGSVTRARETRLTRREVPPETLLSLVSRFESYGASYYQAADGTLVAAERVQLFRRSTFEGTELTSSHTLPMAWPRESIPSHRLTDTCRAKLAPEMPPLVAGRLSEPIRVLPVCFEPTSEQLPPRVAVPLSGQRVSIEGRVFVETTAGAWISESRLHLALVEQPKHALSHDRDKWIHFSVQRGTLVAYEGVTPVFATLASPGTGELNPNGQRRLTPVGTFRINFKHLADDMSREEGEHRAEWKADVPYAMYFNQPYGIHVAYWHEDFGEPKSGGCVNVSPIDGARLFGWTDPQLPNGWFGVGSSTEFGLGTVVQIGP